MKNYSYRRFDGLKWQIRHDQSGAVVTFLEGCYDDTKETDCTDAEIVASIDRIAHEELSSLTECDTRARRSLIECLSFNVFQEVAVKLGNAIGTDYADEYANEEDLLTLLHPASFDVKDLLGSLSNEEMAELIRICSIYNHRPYPFEDWYNDLNKWNK